MSYNILLERPILNLFGTIVSIPHMDMKFPSWSGDITTVNGDQKTVRECYISSLRLPTLLLSTNNVERPSVIGIIIEGEYLNPKVGDDVRIKPMGKSKLFLLQ